MFVPIIILSANKIGFASTLKITVSLWTGAVILLSFLSTNWAAWAIYVIASLMGTGIVGCIVILFIMYPDVTDVGELAFGKRDSGSFSGIMTFLRKFSAAIEIFIVSEILDMAGYHKPVEVTTRGITSNIFQ